MQSVALRVRQWQTASLRDVAWLSVSMGLFVGGKLLGKLAQGIPGHSAALWIPALFVARATVRRPGAATLTALGGAACWGLPRGDGFFDLASYLVAGLTLDALLERPDQLRQLPRALLAGAMAALAKFGFHLIPALLLGASMHSLRLGVSRVALLHLLFGVLGGGLGWLAARKLLARDPDAG